MTLCCLGPWRSSSSRRSLLRLLPRGVCCRTTLRCYLLAIVEDLVPDSFGSPVVGSLGITDDASARTGSAGRRDDDVPLTYTHFSTLHRHRPGRP